jgi:hypothetical protein
LSRWPHGLAAAGRNGGDSAERCEGRFIADAAAAGPGDQELGGGDGADSGPVEQFGANGGDKLFELGFVFGGFGFQEQGATGDGSDRADGGAVLERVSGRRAQPRTLVQLLVGGACA